MVKHGKKTNMNNTTRAVIATAAIGALLIPLAGCGNTTTSSGKTELTVWSWDTSIDRAAKSFMKANPDITVKVSNPGGTDETYTALNNAAQAGSGLPDVTLIEYLAIPQFVHSDTLMELSKVYDTAKLKKTFTPGTWNSVNINGGLYAMPADSGPMAYFYDKDVFDKAGISEPPTTWDEFYEDAKKIRATGSYIASDSGDAGLFNAMMWAMGGHAYKLNDDKLTINITKDKGAQRFMDLWQKMRGTPTAATTSSSAARNITRSSPRPPRTSPASGSSCPLNRTHDPSTATAWDRSSPARPASRQPRPNGRKL